MFALLRKLQLLSAALMVSVSANIGLGCALWRKCYMPPQMRFAELIIEQSDVGEANCAVLNQMSQWDYARLTVELSNQEIVEDGYSRAALALAMLVANFDFDVQRSLGEKALQKRTLKDAKGGVGYELIAGLDGSDFEQIQLFARQEKWPITAQGLHRLIKQGSSLGGSFPHCSEGHLLADAFMASDAFASLERLFPKDIPKSELMTIARCLEWDQLARTMSATSSPPIERYRALQRRQLLMSAVDQGCKTAAYLLILCDYDFSLRHTTDEDLAQLLCLLDTYTAEAMNIALSVLKSPRENAIRELAAKKAGGFLNIPLPTKEDQWRLLARALLGKPSDSSCELSPEVLQARPDIKKMTTEHIHFNQTGESERTHVVQRGDTLWKLSKRYGLTVQQLMALNALQRDLLRIGQILQIDLI